MTPMLLQNMTMLKNLNPHTTILLTEAFVAIAMQGLTETQMHPTKKATPLTLVTATADHTLMPVTADQALITATANQALTTVKDHPLLIA